MAIKKEKDYLFFEGRKNLVNHDGTVNFGSYNEPLNLNFHDYKLKSLFDKKMCKFRTNNVLKKFTYYAITTDKYVIGLGFVKLYIFYNCFIYIYEKGKGIIYKKNIDIIGPKKAKYIGDNYDFTIDYHNRNYSKLFKLNKSSDGFIKVEFAFDRKVKGSIVAKIPSNYERLIVCNPADLHRWTFTEKMYAIPVEQANVTFDNVEIVTDKDKPLLSSDWSAGFYKKHTTWLWWAGQGYSDKHIVGFNFATFINDSLYPERAIWIDNKKHEIPMVKFDIDFEDPHRKMHIYSDDDVVNLTFSIGDVRKDVANRFNLIKTNFRQFVGCYNGYFKIKDKKYEIKNLNGLFELHDSIW